MVGFVYYNDEPFSSFFAYHFSNVVNATLHGIYTSNIYVRIECFVGWYMVVFFIAGNGYDSEEIFPVGHVRPF